MKRIQFIVPIFLLCFIPINTDMFARQSENIPDSIKASGTATDYINYLQKSNLPGLRLASFDIDVTPTAGYEMAFDTVINTWDLGLRAKG
jgi:hypothetical protein